MARTLHDWRIEGERRSHRENLSFYFRLSLVFVVLSMFLPWHSVIADVHFLDHRTFQNIKLHYSGLFYRRDTLIIPTGDKNDYGFTQEWQPEAGQHMTTFFWTFAIAYSFAIIGVCVASGSMVQRLGTGHRRRRRLQLIPLVSLCVLITLLSWYVSGYCNAYEQDKPADRYGPDVYYIRTPGFFGSTERLIDWHQIPWICMDPPEIDHTIKLVWGPDLGFILVLNVAIMQVFMFLELRGLDRLEKSRSLKEAVTGFETTAETSKCVDIGL